MYQWQKACLRGSGILDHRQNLIYTAPTGGGKSLVADVLLLKKVVQDPDQKGILVLPYVALVQEKTKWLRAAVEGVRRNVTDSTASQRVRPEWARPHSDIRVASLFGGSKAKVNWADIDIAVCTTEKANSLVNSLIEDGKIDQVGIVVLDELHMLDDEHRGYLMELMITKILVLDQHTQIIGMSATLSNPQILAEWLRAKYYISKYRPIPTEEFLVFENSIYEAANTKSFMRTASQLSKPTADQASPQAVRTIEKSSHRELDNSMLNSVIALALETAVHGYGALIFCSSRQGCQTMAKLVSECMPPELITGKLSDLRADLLASLQALPGGFEPALSKTLPVGVGFHHAGLTLEERDLVAEAYDRGVLKILVATCSLGAGINLPARRVILNGARMGRELVGPAMLRQMRGRAGRKGKDEVGECYLCCQKQDLEAVAELIEAEIPPVSSCLTPRKRGTQRALLEVVTIRIASTRLSLLEYVRGSLLWQTNDRKEVLATMEEDLQNLVAKGLIEIDSEKTLQPTKLGQAVVASSLCPEDGVFVHKEMLRALESFVMDGDLHIFYLFTPISAVGLSDVSWSTFRDQVERLDDSGLRTLRCIGISPAFVNKIANSCATLKEDTADEIDLARVYRRVFAAFQLRDLCNEIPIHQISSTYGVPRGFVQSLAQTCHGFAYGMVKFCERMEWGMLAAVLEHMLDRLKAGARADLLDMAKVAYVKSRMARILWENGLRSVRALAEADAKGLVPIMMQAQSHKMKLRGEAAEKLQQKLLSKAEIIVASASKLWEKQHFVELDEE